MKYKSYLIVLFFLTFINSYCQQNAYQVFGELLAKSITENDSTTYQSLILPKEAIIEHFKAEVGNELDKEKIESIVKNINENYDNISHTQFRLIFYGLTNKTNIFNLNLKNIKFKIVETKEKKNANIISIHGSINHEKFSHFTFYITNFKGKLYLANHLVHISEVNKLEERKILEEVKMSSDEKGNLIYTGKIELDKRTAKKKEILNCILNSPITIGVEETSKIINNKSSFEYIKGQWGYPYYLNNLSDYAGNIEFKYEFKISNGIIEYKYYDFIHSKDDSKFESIGQLPYEITQPILNVFTKEQYLEIINDVHNNQVLAIKRTRTFTNKCFK